jgi:hypothetical protein
MSMYLGDFIVNSMVYFCWGTNNKNGASVAPTTAGTITVYKDNNTTGSTAGITDTRSFNSVTGIHNCKVDTSSDVFYAVGHDYSVVLVGAVIDGETVNAVLATFSIQNRYMRGTDSAALASVCMETRLAKLDAAISSRASASDYTSARAGKLDNLDAAISSRSTLTAQNVWEYTARTLTSFGTIVSDIWSAATRTLTSFGTLVSDIWSNTTRTLSAATNITSDGNTIDQTKISKLDTAVSSRASASDYTSARASKLDNLDATISSRASGNICTEARLAELDAENLPKATKVLTNKAIQNKSTGAIQYYDDDGETVILTHTPTDGESTIIRTPS